MREVGTVVWRVNWMVTPCCASMRATMPKSNPSEITTPCLDFSASSNIVLKATYASFVRCFWLCRCFGHFPTATTVPQRAQDWLPRAPSSISTGGGPFCSLVTLRLWLLLCRCSWKRAVETQMMPQSSHAYMSCLNGQVLSLHAPCDFSLGQILTIVDKSKREESYHLIAFSTLTLRDPRVWRILLRRSPQLGHKATRCPLWIQSGRFIQSKISANPGASATWS